MFSMKIKWKMNFESCFKDIATAEQKYVVSRKQFVVFEFK